MIRRAERRDVEEICDLVVDYYSKEGLLSRTGAALDAESVETVVRLHLMDGTKCCLVSERDGVVVGTLVGVLSQMPMNLNEVAAQETLAWGEDVDALRDAFDVWAIERGARFSMIACFVRTEADRFRPLKVGR